MSSDSGISKANICRDNADLTIRGYLKLPHPAYNPDLAPSDFFLFGHIKGKMSDCNCESPEVVLNILTDSFTQRDKAMLFTTDGHNKCGD
jgi:hypothetical protein